MAISPRPGIINLDFKDVSQMAQNIQANNPWRTGISALGKILTDREKDILYRRAQAEALGQPTPDETTAVEAVGKGVDWLKEQGDNIASNIGNTALNAYDKVKQLMAPKVEYSEEVGPKIVRQFTDPNDIRGGIQGAALIGTDANLNKSENPILKSPEGTQVVFPTTVINRPYGETTTTVGGKVDWELPSHGYNTEFPTTVVKSYGSLPPKPTQEPDSPVASTEQPTQKLQAPSTLRSQSEAWSEMYRLDPQRAKFDYDRVQNQKKVDIETMKLLGKDANIDDIRAMHNAYMNNLTALYNQGANDDDLRVIEAKAAIEYTAGLLAEKGLLPKSDKSTTKKTQEQIDEENRIGLAAINTGRAAIDMAVDKTGSDGRPDGLVDNEIEIDRALNDLLTSSGLNKNSKEWNTLQSEWSAVKTRFASLKSAALQAKKNAQDDADRSRNINVEGQKAYESNPDVVAYKTARDAMLFYDASDKGIAAKRKMVYDFIKSYNTGTVLDSELASTLGATEDNLGAVLNVIKTAAGLPPSISDSQAEDIYKTLANQLNVLKSNADKAHRNISKVYGTKPQKIADDAEPTRNKGESITDFRKRYTKWKEGKK